MQISSDFDDGNGCGSEIVDFLQKMNVAYTGAGPKFYSLSKTGMKIAAVSSGVNIPDYLTVESLDELDESRLAELGMPLIVKHATGHDSIGLTPKSLVTNRHQLSEQVDRMLKQYGAATVEQYIEGPEYSVLVVENPDDGHSNNPIVLKPVRCQFMSGYTFKHFDLKWIDYNNLTYELVEDPKLAENLKQASKLVFSTCDADGYGRCDFRVDSKTGDIYFLEINANPTIFCDGGFSTADYILNGDPIGFNGFMNLMIKCALKRRQRSTPNIKVAYNFYVTNYDNVTKINRLFLHILASTRNIEKGEIVYVDDCVTLTSGKFIREHWTEEADPLRHRWIGEYAYLIGPDLYRTWSKDPDKWLPINHSCDPNTWVTYDVLVEARRFIKK
uniref:ATP-grasp domain-containing protein n=1 Tax=Romanomermis culicivorax TaxID=13658 RepID=A0A915IRT4_ROMCU